MEPIRVLIADDHPLFRDGMHGLLDSEADTEVVGEAKTGEEAVELAEALRPDVILMDLKMPGINGIQATREILTGARRGRPRRHDVRGRRLGLRRDARRREGIPAERRQGRRGDQRHPGVAAGQAIFGPA
jgi:hypothetical protein